MLTLNPFGMLSLIMSVSLISSQILFGGNANANASIHIQVNKKEKCFYFVLVMIKLKVQFIRHFFFLVSGRIPCPYPGRIWLEQRGFQRAMYWHIEARVVLDLREVVNSVSVF